MEAASAAVQACSPRRPYIAALGLCLTLSEAKQLSSALIATRQRARSSASFEPRHWKRPGLAAFLCAGFALCGLCGCRSRLDKATGAPIDAPFMASVASAPPQSAAPSNAPPADQTGGFDGNRAYAQVAKQVSFGPRPSGSPAIQRLQDYLVAELKSYGCAVETDSFTPDTPAGPIAMKNILVKIPGNKPGIFMLATHYDTKRLDNFLGADDGGSSTAVMIELARLLCAKPAAHPVWIAFFDGEEAVNPQWQDPDNRYGSRQMAARLKISGDLGKIKAFLLADIVGTRDLRFKRESNSTPALTNLVWSTAARLGYSNIFVTEATPIEDDHLSFLGRGVPCVDVIDLEIPYWHTTQDTLDKISAKSLAITGHVFLESIKQLQSR